MAKRIPSRKIFVIRFVVFVCILRASALIPPNLQFETNVIGVIHTTNAFLSLLRAGPTKKVITLSAGLADPDLLEKNGSLYGCTIRHL
jgi:hypothetical protein